VNAVAFIFARGGSKGLPGKNIRNFAGKPLIAWAIEHAKAVPCIRRVIVSTDSEEIASVAENFSAEVPFLRPRHLASDDSPEWLSWQHALEFLKKDEGSLPEAAVIVPVTAPLRLAEDIQRCLQEFARGEADAVITVTDPHRNPYFNMVRRNSDGTVGLAAQPTDPVSRRQDAPELFDVTTVAYVADPAFVMRHRSLFDGRVKAVKVPPERAVDVDSLLDFDIAEFLYHREKP
jgi:CMP-N-acetylneuraminic acid synthetase